MHRLAQAAEQADRLGHQHRRVHSLARHVAKTPGDAPVGEREEIVEVTGDFERRKIDPLHRESRLGLSRQQRALDFAGKIEFAPHALLLEQRFGHLRVMHGERNHAGEDLQELLVGEVEETVSLALVDHFEGTEQAPLDHQRRTENRARAKTGAVVDRGAEIAVGRDIAHHLHTTLSQRAPDDSLRFGDAQAFDGDRPGASQAGELRVCRVEQENGCRLRIHIDHDLANRVVQRFAHRRRSGKILADRREQLEIALEAGTGVVR